MTPSKPLGEAPRALRIGAAILVALGAALLVGATFAAVIGIRVGATAERSLASTGWDRHGPALILLAALALGLLWAALRGSRAGAVGVAAVGLATLVVVVVGDAPHLGDTGDISLVYADSAAGPGLGWYLETAGAVAVLLGGAILALLARAPAPEAGRAVREPRAERARAR